MNILHLHLSKTWGGGGVEMLNLTNYLNRFNSEVKFFFFCAKDGVLESICKEKEFDYQSASIKPKTNPFIAFKLLKYVKANKIDVIHIHGSTALTAFAIANMIQKTPPGIFHKKTTFKLKDKKFTRYKYNHPNIKRIICVSEAVKEVTAKFLNEKEKLVTVYSGTDTKIKAVSSLNLRDKYSIDLNKKLIGNIANHIKAKDLETFVRSVNEIVNVHKRTDFHFLQIGKFSDLTENLNQLVEEFKLIDHITFTGKIDNASQFLDQFDALLFTSKSEGLPQVIYESMLRKLPVVSTNAGGIKELVEHNVNGLIATIGEYKSLAKLLLHIFENSEKTKTFVERSHLKIINNYTLETMVKNMNNIYKQVAIEG